MSVLEGKRETPDGALLMDADTIRRQRFQMLVALGILLCALILVLIKDWQFWFSSSATPEVQPTEQVTSESETESAATQPATTVTPTPAKAKQRAITTAPAPLSVPAGG